MGCRHDLDQSAGEVEAAVPAALHHALEPLGDGLRAEMSHGDVEAAALGNVAGAHFARHGAAHDVAGGALQPVVIALHEACAVAAQQMAARAAQALLQHGAGHAGAGAGIEARRVELHHLHVAERQARLQGHRHAVAGLVARRRVVAVHGGAAAGREQHGLRAHEAQRAGADVDQEDARQAASRRGEGTKRRRAVLLQPCDRPRPDLLHQPVDDLDAGQVALVDGAVEGLAGERLLVDAAVRDCGRNSSRSHLPVRGCAPPRLRSASRRAAGG